LRDRFRRARLDAQIAVDATQIVDLVDEPVAFAGADRLVGRIVLASDVDAARWADARAQLTADALLHAVFVPVEHVTPVETNGLLALLLRILDRDDASVLAAVEQLAERDAEPFQVTHQRAPSDSRSSFRRRSAVRRASAS